MLPMRLLAGMVFAILIAGVILAPWRQPEREPKKPAPEWAPAEPPAPVAIPLPHFTPAQLAAVPSPVEPSAAGHEHRLIHPQEERSGFSLPRPAGQPLLVNGAGPLGPVSRPVPAMLEVPYADPETFREALVPAVFGLSDRSFALDPAVAEEVAAMADAFADSVGVPGPEGPDDPAYVAAWEAAAWESDSLFRLRYGHRAYVLMQLEARRNAAAP